MTQAFCRLQLEMKGEATEAQQFRLGCGSQQRELQNTTELRTTASEIVAPKPDLDARAKKRRF